MGNHTEMIWSLDALQRYRERILALAEAYGAYNIRVFGSVARGEATIESDIDLLVSTRDGVRVFDMVGLWLALKELLNCEVSLVTEGIEDRAFLQRIQGDLIPL